MESKALDSVLRTTDATRNSGDEISAGDRKKKTQEEYGNKEVELTKKYDAVSKNGDTLELSEDGKKMGEHSDMNNSAHSVKKIISDSGKKMSDNTLISYSEAKLKQLYANKEITKQQYERILKRKKSGS